MATALIDLVTAYDDVASLFQAVPDDSLDWRPHKDEFSLKQILVHLTHANDFYLMIVEETLAMNFAVVRLHSGLPGWQRMGVTDAEAWQCQNVASLYECFERAFQRLLTVLAGITDEDFERVFVLYEMQPEAEARTVTLAERVIQMAASHLREHRAQLAETLTGWQSTQMAPEWLNIASSMSCGRGDAMTANLVTQQKLDELLAFLPLFEEGNCQWITSWDGGYPHYVEAVERFFALAGEACWIDQGYKPIESSEMLKDANFIKRANWEQVKQMLTFCVRSERFNDGAWAGAIESGKIVLLLRRIAALGPERSR